MIKNILNSVQYRIKPCAEQRTFYVAMYDIFGIVHRTTEAAHSAKTFSLYMHYSCCLACVRPHWPLEKPCLLQATPHEFTLTTVEI